MERGVNGASFTVLLYEFKDGLTRYFASLGETAVLAGALAHGRRTALYNVFVRSRAVLR